jgi:hypothetical protein
MEGTKMEKVIEEKYLGVMISSELKVSKQCIMAAKKGNQILELIKRTMIHHLQKKGSYFEIIQIFGKAALGVLPTSSTVCSLSKALTRI